ncbi:MAG: endonuclease/exonuclease/phosphatase family protein [Phycisphaerales bacterium]
MARRLFLGTAALAAALAIAPTACARQSEQRLRVATFNIHDAKTAEVASGDDDRLKRIAEAILDIRPDVILLNEIDQDEHGLNGQRFADNYLAVALGDHKPIAYHAFMRASNTGVHAGLDLDNNGVCDPNTTGRDFGGDTLGYGEYPGQYAMALLVREGLTIDEPNARTFQHLLWKDMPGALLPPLTAIEGETEPWYSDEELAVLPLSSKSHWDVPVILENGATIHILASHPTPPVFDGPEDRNGRRNHDEIRFFADYISGGQHAAYITDDAGTSGGLSPDALFVMLGDLNADPDTGDSRDNPVRMLLSNKRVQGVMVPFSVTPTLKTDRAGNTSVLGDSVTSMFAMRIDYVLPSVGMRQLGARVYRTPLDTQVAVETPRSSYRSPQNAERFAASEFPSDHFPVFVDLLVPAP